MLKNEESAIFQYSIKNIEIGQIFPIIDSSKVGGAYFAKIGYFSSINYQCQYRLLRVLSFHDLSDTQKLFWLFVVCTNLPQLPSMISWHDDKVFVKI